MRQQRIFAIVLVALWFTLGANGLVAQEHFPTLTGTVVGIEGGARKWLEVKSDTDGVTVNFRIGRNTVYVPQKYPDIGEKVRILYVVDKGVNVATKVLIFKDSAN
jgi:hypothetical protein